MLTVDIVTGHRNVILEAGFWPVEVENARLGDKNSGKAPVRPQWQVRGTSVSLATSTALNTGILCDGLRAIDIDIDNPTLADRCQQVAEEMFGRTLRRYRADSSRCLLLYRAATGEPHKLAIAGTSGKIEVLGRGNQFVAFGTHWEHGAELEWEPFAPGVEMFEDLTPIDEDGVKAFLQRCAPIIGAKWEPQRTNGQDHRPQADLQADPLRIARAIEALPNADPANWEAWNRVGMAIWAASGASDLGWELFNAWSARNAAYDVVQCRERWRHYATSPPTRIGAGSLFYWEAEARRPDDEAPAENRPAFTATSFDAARALAHPPREWVYGHFLIRRFLSVLGAPGGIGKTAYAMAVGISVALGQPLLGETVHDPGPVWVYNLEDPQDEADKRAIAICKLHDIDPKRLENRLYLDSGRDRPLIVAKLDKYGNLIPVPVVDELITELKARKIKLLIVDPFVKSHRLEENRNEQIDFAAQQWSRVADEADCAILLVHHFRKGASGNGDADAFRGASALIDAARGALAMAIMSAEEASLFGIEDVDRRQFFRLDNAKLNLARPPNVATWMELCSVELDNASATRPADNVQAARRWEPPAALDGMSMPMIVRIVDKLRAGPGDGEQYTLTATSADKSRWAGSVVMDVAAKTDRQASAILRLWTDAKLLTATRYTSPKQRRERGGLSVNLMRLSEMRRQAEAGFDASQ